MTLSAFDLFSIGIGPSSSHTVGPMRASGRFVGELREVGTLGEVRRVHVRLFGSLGATGTGHGTPGAVFAGLEGHVPESVDPALVPALAGSRHRLILGADGHGPPCDVTLELCPAERRPRHPNGLQYLAYDAADQLLLDRVYYSVGGGFVEREDEPPPQAPSVPHPFATAAELLEQCRRLDASISEVMWRNECATRSPTAVRHGLLAIWSTMTQCIERGFRETGELPGGLRVRRRAPEHYRRLSEAGEEPALNDWLVAAAMAVNEENAAGGRIVTAPTNGAAGIVPAVLYWALRHVDPTDREDAIIRFLLCSAAIAVLFKEGASVSGAEVGCQGEVGSACAMAAGAAAELFGGTPAQVENAAEIGIEHNLGLTCDPIGGLVQVPCIERNAVAAVKAVTAARIALHGDGTHRVHLDQAIEAMRQTGLDMHAKYKETSTGGLAVSVPAC